MAPKPSSRRTLKSLLSSQTMPLPREPVVRDYGAYWVGVGHDIVLFPAVLRKPSPVKVEPNLEAAGAVCFYHDHLPATAVCSLSGRLICDLCKTEWEGQVVSIQAVVEQSKAGKKSKDQPMQQRFLWDNLALGLSTFPLLMWPLTLITAPAALGVCLVKWRKGPTGLLRRSRWRYYLAGFLATTQIAGWGFLFAGIFLWSS